MIKTKRKGFTIVELVIVIAVIAILAAVLIPTFASLIRKANVSNDTMLVRNLNMALAADMKEHNTMQDALDVAEDFGYDVAKINSTSVTENEIMWDSVNDCFVYINEGKVEYIPDSQKTQETIENYKYFRIKTAPTSGTEWDLSVENYSVYLYGEYEGTVKTDKGFDAGKSSKVAAVEYTNVSGLGKDVVLRTNGGNLIVDGETDDVRHYGWAAELTVKKVSSQHCYHEFGYIGKLESFGSGKFVAESVAVFHQTEAEITSVLSGKTADLGNGETYGEHFYKDGKCVICDHTQGGSEPTPKNGLVDGYYYKNNELFTGEENGHEFKNGMLVIKLYNKELIRHDINNTVATRKYNYVIQNHDYLTKEVVINGDNAAYDGKAIINITDNTGTGYSVKSVAAKEPFNGLLDKDGWTAEDIDKLMNTSGKSLLATDGYSITNSNKLSNYDGTDGTDPDDYDIFIPKLCADSTVVKNYLNLVADGTVQKYKELYDNNGLIITLADYLKLSYGKGFTLAKEGDIIKYNKSFGNNYQSQKNGSFYVKVEADGNGCPSMSFVGSSGEYFTALTKVIDDGHGGKKIALEDHVIDADGTTPNEGGKLTMLSWFTSTDYYISFENNYVYKNDSNWNAVVLRQGSPTGQENCKFIISADGKCIRAFMNSEEVTDANGVLCSVPSSGDVTLVDGKISLTGNFDVTGIKLSSSALSNLSGISNTNMIMFEPGVIEQVMKALYKGNLTVLSGAQEYELSEIPISIFTKNDNTISATLENNLKDFTIYNNLFNSIDFAGTSFEIILSTETLL